MKTHARVGVIGGGVVGCSVLYHLTKLGWSDVMLIERSELTSGSTWHAAGGFHTLNGDTNMAALQGYTIRLYKELEAITDDAERETRVRELTEMAQDNAKAINAAQLFELDDVIDPAETRNLIAATLQAAGPTEPSHRNVDAW